MLLRRDDAGVLFFAAHSLSSMPLRFKSKAFGQLFVYKREFFTFHFSLFTFLCIFVAQIVNYNVANERIEHT